MLRNGDFMELSMFPKLKINIHAKNEGITGTAAKIVNKILSFLPCVTTLHNT